MDKSFADVMEVLRYWLGKTYSAASQAEVVKAQQVIGELMKRDDFPLVVIELVNSDASSCSLKRAGVIQLMLWMRGIKEKSESVVRAFLESLVVMLDVIGEEIEPICRKLCNQLCMRMAYENLVPEFPSQILELVRGRPPAGLMLASAYAKAISDPGFKYREMYATFSAGIIPLLRPVLESNSLRLVILSFKVMCRFTRTQLPPVVVKDMEILGFWVSAALNSLNQQNGEVTSLRLVEVVLVFLSRVSVFCQGVPDVVVDCALSFAMKSLSPVATGAALHIIYNLIRNGTKNELLLTKFEGMLTNVILPIFVQEGLSVDCTDRACCWKEPVISSIHVMLLYLQTFPALLPWFLSFLSSRKDADLVAGLHLLSFLVKDLVENEAYCQLLSQFIVGIQPLASSPVEALRCVFLKVIRDAHPLPPDYFAATLNMLNDQSSDVKYEASITASSILASGTITEAMAQELSRHIKNLITLFIQLETEYMNTDMAIALRNLTSSLLPAITEVDPQWLNILLDLFTSFEKNSNDISLLIGSSMTNLVLTGAISCTFLVEPLVAILNSLTYKPALDKILEILAAVIHAIPTFDLSLWKLVPICFQLMDAYDSVFFADVSIILSNLIWRGRDADRSFHHELFTQLTAFLSHHDSADDLASVLDVISDLLFVLHGEDAIASQVPSLTEQMLAHIEATGDCHIFHIFLDALFIFYPEPSSQSPHLTSLWLAASQPPLFQFSVLKAFDHLPPEIQQRALSAAHSLSDCDDFDPARPVWFDAQAVAAALPKNV